MRSEDLGRAIALIGARLRGDADGERVLLGDGGEDRQLVQALLLVAEIVFTQAAAYDGVTRTEAADTATRVLQQMLTDRGHR